MPLASFKFVGLTPDGRRLSGIMDGATEAEAVGRIRERCGIILRITPVRERSFNLLNMEIGGNHLNVKAFTLVCSQFSIILNAGIPIARAVQLIADKTVDKPLKKLLTAVGKDVEAGHSLAASFTEHGEKLLPLTFIEMIHAGEASGNLAGAFERMRVHFDKQVKIGSKVRSAMAYPLFVLVIAIAVVIVLMVVVVPRFMVMFEEMDAELPLITRILIGISNFFKNNIVFIGIGLLIVVIIWEFFASTEFGRMAIAKAKLKMPILGNIQNLNAASQFANTMTAMLGAGLPMNRAVEITARVLDNHYISTKTATLTDDLEKGAALSESMRKLEVYPDILVDMVGVGEQSGELEKTLGTIAVYYDTELDEAVQSALAKLEPTMLVVLAGIAGFIVMAIYMAIFSMYGSMGNL